LRTGSSPNLCNALLCGLGYGLRLLFSFRLFLGGELMLDLEGNRIGVHLVRLGCSAENLTSVRLLAGGKQDDGFDDQLADDAFLGLAQKGREQLGCGFAFLRSDASVPGDHLQPLVVEQREHLFGDEEKISLHQSDWNGGDDGLQYAHSGGVRQCLFLAALVLLRFEAGIGLRGLLLGVMNRAIRFGANPPHFALVNAFGDDGFGDELARLELRLLRFLRGVRLVRANLDVLAAGDDLAAILRLAVGSADLHYLRLGCNLLLYVRL